MIVNNKILDSSAIGTFPYQELVSNAVDSEYEGIQIKVCSLGDLPAMKRAADRTLDRLDLEALEIAHPEDPESR